MNKREVMKVENLVRNYKMVYSDRQGEEEIKVLKGLDFTIEEQEFVGIMGKSGCGKTTLLKEVGVKVEEQLDYPGIIRVVGIRETKVVDYLR